MEQVRWEIEQQSPGSRWLGRRLAAIGESLDRHPFWWSSVVQTAVFVAAWVAGSATLFPNITFFEVEDPSSVIATAWQVLAGFASIAFAGLAVLMQLTSEPVVTSRGVRQVLFKESQFRPVLAFSITGAIQVGAGALLLGESEAAVIEVVVVAVTILLIGWSYARVGAVYSDPGEALRLGEAALQRDLVSSMREARSRAVAESRLHKVVPREWRLFSISPLDGIVLLRADRSAALSDVDIDLINDVVNEIADGDSSALEASDASTGPAEPATADSPELRIATSLGSTVEAGSEVFVLKNPASFAGNRNRVASRLAKALRWEEAT